MVSDFSLLEISAEDDSLLQQFPADDISNFACSPLQIPSSGVTKNKENNRELGCSSSYRNKENLNTNDIKSGMPNLSVEPQKMKRSRKAGGYSLRKSLAWDSAFLTEEGVLNSSELSRISGTPVKLDRDRLCVIDEQGRELLNMNSDVVGGSNNLEILEEDLFKEFPSCSVKKRNTSSSSFLKQDFSTGACLASNSKKIPSCHDVSKTAFKGGDYSTPVALSSQRRLLNTGTTKVMARNSKIPRFPASKKDPCLSPMIDKHTVPSGSRLKCTGIPRPGAQKRLSLKLPSNVKNAAIVAKPSSESISKVTKPAENARKDVENSSLKRHSLTNPQAQHITKISKPEDAVTSTHGTNNTTVSVHCNSDSVAANRKDVQVQGIKPSGLRMPSPSLRFFSESNTHPSFTPSQGNIKTSNLLKSSISTSRNPRAEDQINDALNHDAKGKASVCSQMIDKCSTSSTVDPKAHDKSIWKEYNQRKVKLRVPLGVKNPGQTNDEEFGYDFLDKQYMDRVSTSLKDETTAQCHDSSVTSQGGEEHPQCPQRREIVESCVSEHSASTAYKKSTEVIPYASNLVGEEQGSKNESPVKEPMSQTNELDLNDIVLKHNCLKRNREICEVRNSTEVVENQIESLAQLSNSGNDSNVETTNLELHSSARISKDHEISPVANPNAEESCSQGDRDETGTRISPQIDRLIGEDGCNKKDRERTDEEDVNSKLTLEDDEKIKGLALNTIPFSDEWLAAIEAAGEEILTLKTGAVQHSPPDKSVPEPGPWSPVKRKSNQVVGPFDCTKHTNIQRNNSD